jgi:hypothetical protein
MLVCMFVKSVFRVCDILVRISIRVSVPLTNGSGFGSCSCCDLQYVNKNSDFLLFTF